MSKKISKDELRQPDAFISTTDKISKALSDYSKPIMAVAAVFLIGGGGKVGYDSYQKVVEKRAQEALYEVDDKAIKIKAEVDKTNPLADQAQSAESQLEKTPAMLKEKFGPVLSGYESVIGEFNGTQASYIAALNLSQLSLEYGDLAAGQKALEKVSGSMSNKHLFWGLIHIQLHTLQMSLGQLDQAIAGFDSISNNPHASFLHSEAILKLGLCYEQKKELDKAKELYNKVATEFSESQAAKTAKSYLRWIELNANKGS